MTHFMLELKNQYKRYTEVLCNLSNLVVFFQIENVSQALHGHNPMIVFNSHWWNFRNPISLNKYYITHDEYDELVELNWNWIR